MKRAIITVVGKDTVGIIASVCGYLADKKINILDISQTIVDGYFNMMMITDVSKASQEIAQISKELNQKGQDMGLVIHCQHEDIFNKMHRI
ncbi:MAG TPA: ACT domain-containing protein [Lachnospiraceae bacterium]